MHAIVFMYRKWRIGLVASLGVKWTRIALGLNLVVTPSDGHILVESGISLGPFWFNFDFQFCTHSLDEAHEPEPATEEAKSEDH